ncbi:MAG: hypothetical protein JSS83_26370 [Cyanobacteria bacterium SZAS LIN-3]|nr:hypothetical protein [Cyanobacteria bacterium SZAS LIN-3]
MYEAQRQKIASSAGWFLWIAGCTFINIILYSIKNDTRLVLGATTVEVAAIIFNDLSALSPEVKIIITYVIGIIGSGIYLALMKPASQGRIWAFVIGIVLYGLDGVANVLMQAWMGTAIHAWGLYSLAGGVQAAMALKKLNPPSEPAEPVQPS